MNATIFVTLSYGVILGESMYMTEQAPTAGECLHKLQDRLGQKMGYTPTLTFRLLDGMIFWGDVSSTIPIGVLYQEGYLPK